jgi:hypothetical protein
VSHHPERKDKNCLNCGTIVSGRYCQNCGQENIETRESFWSLMKDFVFDIIHFDGNFFHTLKYMFTRPGYVARQYAEGKRASFLHPIRMYLFTSAVFFLVFFSLNNDFFFKKNGKDILTSEERKEMASDLEEDLRHDGSDSVKLKKIQMLRDTSKAITATDIALIAPDRLQTGKDIDYTSIHQYDSIQNTLPEKERDGWFSRRMEIRKIEITEKYKNRPDEIVSTFGEAFLHRLPYLLFLSLPFFALILKLLYVRRKNFYYSDHAIFTLYHYVFSFILLLLIFGVNSLKKWLGWGWMAYLITALVLYWPIYLFLEMRRFYLQGKGKTFLKFLLLNFLGVLVLLLLFVVFMIISLLQM